MYLIQLLLPLHDNNQQRFSAEKFERIRNELTEKFGGVTAFVRSPAVGLWKEKDDAVTRDEVVRFEVVSESLDEKWWAQYRRTLQVSFRQDELLIWAANVTKL